jgi:anti-sigma-K factor RskA
MPPASPGKDYQLWVVDPQNPVPVSAGVLRVANDEEVKISFIPDKPVNSVSKFVISVEPAGGVPKSVGPAILVSN